jgi:DNA-binding NtrC family response regulator
MPQPLQLLIAEDNPADAELELRALRQAGYEPVWKRVDTEADFIQALHPGLDLVISDYAMPGFSGLRAIQLIREHSPQTPLIIISGTIGEDTAVEAMRLGASDYLLKDRLTRLGVATSHVLAQSRLHRQARDAEGKVREQLAELMRWQGLMLDRETRVQALKAEVNALLARQNLPPRYASPGSL